MNSLHGILFWRSTYRGCHCPKHHTICSGGTSEVSYSFDFTDLYGSHMSAYTILSLLNKLKKKQI